MESAGGGRSIRELFDTINVQGNSIDCQEVEQFFQLTGPPLKTLYQAAAILLLQELLSSLTSLQQLRQRMARYLSSTLSR